MQFKESYYKLLRQLKTQENRNKQSQLLNSLLKLIVQLPLSESKKSLIRQLIDALLPGPSFDTKAANPNIAALICCTNKDSKKLPAAIEQLLKNSINTIVEIHVISPQRISLQRKEDWPSIYYWEDSEIIDEFGQIQLVDNSPRHRFSWILQQVLKLSFALNSKEKYLLIMDADTFLIRPHLFVDQNGIQGLSFSNEFHKPYNLHANEFFGLQNKEFSYVTHYQLWQTRFIREMFPEGFKSILEWVGKGDTSEQSPVSEYHSYGSWLAGKYPEKIRWVSWRNASYPPTSELDLRLLESKLTSRFGDLNSISLHNYLRE